VVAGKDKYPPLGRKEQPSSFSAVPVWCYPGLVADLAEGNWEEASRSEVPYAERYHHNEKGKEGEGKQAPRGSKRGIPYLLRGGGGGWFDIAGAENRRRRGVQGVLIAGLSRRVDRFVLGTNR